MSITIPFTEIATPRQVGARNDTLSFVIACHFRHCEALLSPVSLRRSLVTFVIARSEATKQSQLVLRSEPRKADSAPLP
jgi:hypothetical protein